MTRINIMIHDSGIWTTSLWDHQTKKPVDISDPENEVRKRLESEWPGLVEAALSHEKLSELEAKNKRIVELEAALATALEAL